MDIDIHSYIDRYIYIYIYMYIYIYIIYVYIYRAACDWLQPTGTATGSTAGMALGHRGAPLPVCACLPTGQCAS